MTKRFLLRFFDTFAQLALGGEVVS